MPRVVPGAAQGVVSGVVPEVAPEVARAAASGADARVAAGLAPNGPAPSPAPASVLVVDDDAAVAALVAAVLRRAGIDVVVVESGEAALERLAVRSWQLVLTDMTMPGLSGLELLATAEARGHHVPFLVMSAFFDAETERRLCEHPGVTGILRKPFDIRRLVDDVRAVLERPRADTVAAGAAAAGSVSADAPTPHVARELPVRWERAFAVWQATRGTTSPAVLREVGRSEPMPQRPAPAREAVVSAHSAPARAGPAGEAGAC